MIGRLKEMFRSRDGTGWIVTFFTKEKIDGDRFDELAKHECDIEIRRHREKRSKNANAYLHVLINKIAGETGESEEEVKIRLVTSYGPLARTNDGKYLLFVLPREADATDYYKYAVLYDQREINGTICNCWKVYKDTHKMDTKEMSNLIDGAVREAKELGIETETPAQLEKMRQQWAEYEAAHPRKED